MTSDRWEISTNNDYCDYKEYPCWAKGNSTTYCRLTEDDDADDLDSLTAKECSFENCPIKVKQ